MFLREVLALAVRASILWALIIRIGFRGPLYYNCNKEPYNSRGNYLGPDINQTEFV